MIIVTIGGDRRQWSSLDEVEESWINQQINGRREDNIAALCTRVEITELNLILSTPGCVGSGGGGGTLSSDQQEVVALWRDHGLNNSNYNGGNIVAFLKRLRRVL